jgi:hypothetical protein
MISHTSQNIRYHSPSQNIRYHSPSDTYIISKKSYFDQDVLINGNVMVGPGVHFWKNVKIQGNAQFGKGCVIEGRLDAENALIGSQSVVKGPIHVSGDISLFQNVVVRSIESSGSIVVMEGCTADYINGKKLEIIGKAQVKKIGTVTKMTVKADNMNCSNNIEEKNIDFFELEMSPECVFEIEIDAKNNSNTQATPAQQVNDQLTPLFPVENTKEDAEFIVSGYPKPKLSEIASVPHDEMLNVELIYEADEKNKATDLQTVETPFGAVVVGDGSNMPSVPNPITDPASGPVSKSQISSSPQVSSSKRKPYPDFVPMVVSAEEKKKHFSQNKSSQTTNRGAESKSLPNPKNKPVPSKITFETLPLKTKAEETEIKIVKKPAEEIEAEHTNSKLWYEERVKPAQKVPKKYPP